MRTFSIKNRLNYESYFPLIFTFIFIILSIILISNHEYWLDEAHHWFIVSESNSINELVENLRDGAGTPFLWHIIIYFISHYIIDNIIIIKIFSLTISTSIAFLFLKYAPFNKIIKVLFIFGYFPFFEYSIISRTYSLGILFMIIFCILYEKKYKRLILISIVLFLMAQTTAYAFLISIALSISLGIELILDFKKVKKEIKVYKILISALIIIVGIILFFWQIGDQLKGNYWEASARSIINRSFRQYEYSLLTFLPNIIKVYFQVPDVKLNFWWDSNLLISSISNINLNFLIPIISLVLLIIPIFILKRRAILYYLLGTAFLFSFIVLVGKEFAGRLRHFGHIFILFILCLWIGEKNNNIYLLKINKNFFLKFSKFFVLLVLIFSIIGSSIAFYYDYNYPFAPEKEFAEYLNQKYDINNTFIVGYRDTNFVAVALYLDKDIYYPQINKISKNTYWKNRLHEMSPDDIFKKAHSLTNSKEKTIVVLEGPIMENVDSKHILENYGFKKVDSKYCDSIVTPIRFHIYEFIEE